MGKTWVAPYSNVSLSISSATSSALDVNVFYGPIPCVEAAPTVAISPSNPSAYAGADVSYDVSVANNDTNSCSSRSFDVASLLPDALADRTVADVLTIPPSSSDLQSQSEGSCGRISGECESHVRQSNCNLQFRQFQRSMILRPPAILNCEIAAGRRSLIRGSAMRVRKGLSNSEFPTLNLIRKGSSHQASGLRRISCRNVLSAAV